MQVEPVLEMAQAVRLHREWWCELCLVLQSLRCLVHRGPGASGVGFLLEARSKYLPPFIFFKKGFCGYLCLVYWCQPGDVGEQRMKGYCICEGKEGPSMGEGSAGCNEVVECEAVVAETGQQKCLAVT